MGGGGLDHRRLDILERDLEDERAMRLQAESQARDALRQYDDVSERHDVLLREVQEERARVSEHANKLRAAGEDIRELRAQLADARKLGGQR